jgi:hypothetical protein
MSRRARHEAHYIRRQKRFSQRLEQQARPLTAGELTVIQQRLINASRTEAQQPWTLVSLTCERTPRNRKLKHACLDQE